VIAGLLAFDAISMSLEITDSHVADPMLLWSELDIGCLLEPLVKHATSNHKKVSLMFRSAKLLADSEETVQLARKLACTKPTGSAGKDSRPDKVAETQQGKGKGKKGKGKGMIAEMKRINANSLEPAVPKKGKEPAIAKGGKGGFHDIPLSHKAKPFKPRDAEPKWTQVTPKNNWGTFDSWAAPQSTQGPCPW